MLPNRAVIAMQSLAGPRPESRRRWRGYGQGLVEYGLILSLMVVVAAVILVVFGGTLAEVLSVIGSAIDGPS